MIGIFAGVVANIAAIYIAVPLIHPLKLTSVYEVCKINEPWHEISNNVVDSTIKASDQPAHTRSLIRAFASRLHILGVSSY